MKSSVDGSERKRRRVDDGGEKEDKDSMIKELKRKLSEAEGRIATLQQELTDFKQKSEEKSAVMTTFEVEEKEDEVIPPGKRTKRAPQLVPTMFSLNETGSQTMTARPRLDRFASIQTKMVIDKLPTIQRGANATVLRVLEKIDGAVTSEKGLTGHSTDASTYFYSARFMQDIVSMSKEVSNIFSNESRLLSLPSPVHVFGDIHGNEADLRYFSEKIWPRGMCLTPGRFLFLGDYVDRGMSSLEIVAYLFAYKITYPQKVYMLRGNHETRAVNGWESYYGAGSLLAQCKKRFGTDSGTELWEQINQAFDVMPLAAIIDSSIFCVHGGIPRPQHAVSSSSSGEELPDSTSLGTKHKDRRLEEIRHMPVRLGVRPRFPHETNDVNRMAVDLLWSDPAKARQEGHLNDDGFGEGLRDPDAVCFGEKAVNDFLNRFGLSYVVRAHEPTYSGVAVSKSARVLTVFSTSKDHGCGEGAACGCILVDNDYIYAINRQGSLARNTSASSVSNNVHFDVDEEEVEEERDDDIDDDDDDDDDDDSDIDDDF